MSLEAFTNKDKILLKLKYMGMNAEHFERTGAEETARDIYEDMVNMMRKYEITNEEYKKYVKGDD